MSNLKIMRAILLVMFVGWILVWVLLPTNIYKQTWTPNLQIKLNSTYFREHGINLLLFTFPVMFIAVFGSLYLHFQMKHQKSDSKELKNKGLSILKKPVLVMGPFGILTAVELTFVAMFVVLLIWSLSNYLHISFGHLHMHKQGEKVWQAKFRSVSLRLGYIGNVCWAFLFFPVTRGSSLLPLFGLTSESSIKYHIWLGHLSMILFAAHSLGFLIYYAMTNQMVEAIEWSRSYVPNVAGEIAFVVAMIMWVTSYPRIRRKMFEVFFYTHHLYILYIFFYILHVGAAYLCMILPGIFLFLIDRYLRFLQSTRTATLISARLLPCHAVELTFSKTHGLRYNPTSILFINIPSISKLQWHPFTVTSNCNMEEDKLSIVIKSEGSWSQNLCQQLSSSHGDDQLQVSVEGPYGPTSSHFLSHETLVMVSGGSGITPFISIIREIIYQSNKTNTHIPQILVISSFKNSSDLSMLDLLLPISVNPIDISKIKLKIEAYITREKDDSTTDTQKLIQTIWFKPNSLGSPICAALGSNSWMWLAAIITSSFIMFLLFLGIITRFYIYPIEQNGSQVYNFSYKTLWDMFLVCTSIFVTSSVVFSFCKKQHIKQVNQIQNVEVPTPLTSPGSLIYNADIELETLPHHSLLQSTNLHFGTRPDLKKILFDCKGSDVGVLVCGPRKMRHEVAKICSSGLADNLHFESISFNW